MKAWQVTHYGEPEEMTFADVDTPTPGGGQVLINNSACGLNFFDLLQCQGKYQSKPEFPFTIGAEVSGCIEAVGPGAAQEREQIVGPFGNGRAGQRPSARDV